MINLKIKIINLNLKEPIPLVSRGGGISLKLCMINFKIKIINLKLKEPIPLLIRGAGIS